MKREIIRTEKAPAPIGPYSQAVSAKGILFVSGQIAINPETQELNMPDLATETRQVMANLNAVLEAANTSFAQVIKTSIFLSDMSLFPEVNQIYSEYFTDNYPARETVAVKGLPKNVNVEISMIVQLS